jgi:hypothetical protein
MQVFDIPVVVAWEDMKPGASFFVPCIDSVSVEQAIQKETARLQINVTIKQVVEKQVYGLRVWRNHGTMRSHSPPSKAKD